VIAAALASCENEVSVQLLPGDKQALVVPDAAASDADAGSADAGGADTANDDAPLANALWFRGAYDRVEIPSSPLLDVPQDFAVEAWVYVKSYEGGHGVLNRWVAGVGDIELTFGAPEPVAYEEFPSNDPVPSHVLATWGYVRQGLWITTTAPTLPSAGAWHHIASSYGGGALKLYVDGKLASSASGTDRIANCDNPFYIGATSRTERPFDSSKGTPWWPPIDGSIGEVRISSKDRYPADFSPDKRLAADADTIALWHLDEGQGSVAIDSGPSHLNGAIIGPEWATGPLR
jgi:hypothetical protein